MISVEEAEKIIQSEARDFGMEELPFESALGRVLAKDVQADRDLPPYNRVTMDGIAIRYDAFEKGTRTFQIKAIQAAGDDPVQINGPDECIEIMTGAALDHTADTVVRYEDLEIKNGHASLISDSVAKGQSIHYRGKDKKELDVLAKANQNITPALTGLAASVGSTTLSVWKLPRTVIISSGDELVEVNENPLPFQIRRSNNYTVNAVLAQYGLRASMLHIPDDPVIIREQVAVCLQHYDVIILSGGISMGKFDYIPDALEKLSVKKLFHKVSQRPGKPFWFGKHLNGVLVFAFPGNPVSTFMCLHRYFLPWLHASMHLDQNCLPYAILNEDFSFNFPLQYFLQVKLTVSGNGHLLATPAEGNGSGDYSNLLNADAFIELPMEKNSFIKGEVFRVWPFKQFFV